MGKELQIGINAILDSLSFSGVLLDRTGTILEVSNGWREFADRNGFALPRHGLGLNYLKYCVFPDAQSVDIVRGLLGVINRTVDFFSTLYSCGTPERPKWLMLIAFPTAKNVPTITVAHLDMSGLLQTLAVPSAMMLSMGGAAQEQIHEAIKTTIRRTVSESFAAAVSRTGERGMPMGADDRRNLSRLSEMQLNILRHLSTGASNAKIAEALGISLNAAKAQTAAMIKKLGLDNRTQVALYAVRIGLGSQ